MSTSLECRLLCASVCSYSIQAGGPVYHEQPYFDAARFAREPVAGVGGPRDINACLVGTTVDGVVVAFRGTLPPDSPDHEQTVRDWINDLNAELVHGGVLPGLVHEGFWKSLDSLWAWLVPEVQRQLGQAGVGRNLYVTGHSKGGALANLAAMRLKVEKGINGAVYTFAGPHPGNDDFAAVYDRLIQSIRYEYADDIVPLLPPSLAFRHMFSAVTFLQPYVHRLDLNYAAVGTLRYVQQDGTIVGDSPMLRFRRFESLARLIMAGAFDEIVEDHDSRCGGGYMKGACPTDVCA